MRLIPDSEFGQPHGPNGSETYSAHRRASLRHAGVLFILLALAGAAAAPLGLFLGLHHAVIEAVMPPLWLGLVAVVALALCQVTRLSR
jgi:hypothetical protein